MGGQASASPLLLTTGYHHHRHHRRRRVAPSSCQSGFVGYTASGFVLSSCRAAIVIVLLIHGCCAFVSTNDARTTRVAAARANDDWSRVPTAPQPSTTSPRGTFLRHARLTPTVACRGLYTTTLDARGRVGDEEERFEAERENEYQRSNVDDDVREYFATCIPGLQGALSSELTALGALDVTIVGSSGASFAGSPTLGMKCVLWCRTAHRIMERIASTKSVAEGGGPIEDRDGLYNFVRSSVHAQSLLGDGRGGLLTLSVRTVYARGGASSAPRELCHGHYTALTVKNALVDAVRDLRPDGDRPDVDVEDADVPLVVTVGGWMGRTADVDLYRCLNAGGSLHRRGYRKSSETAGASGDSDDNDYEDNEHRGGTRSGRGKRGGGRGDDGGGPIHRAAMKETLAAGLLLNAGWDKLVAAALSDGKGAVLIDPMTGSGTLPVEAALMACDVAPGLMRIASWRGGGGNNGGRGESNPHRNPPAVRWKDFGDEVSWTDLLADAERRAKAGMKWASSPLTLAPEGDDDDGSTATTTTNVAIYGNEKNSRAIELARSCVANADVGSVVSLRRGDCLDWDLGAPDDDYKEDDRGRSSERAVLEGRTIFVCNPPWGLRLTEDIDESWVSLREFFRREGPGAEAWVLSGNKDLTKILRMKKSRSVPLRTAGEDLRWLQYHIFNKSAVALRE